MYDKLGQPKRRKATCEINAWTPVCRMLPPGQAVTNWRIWPALSLILMITLLTSHLRASNNAASTNTEWLAIWETKGVSIGKDEPLHHANGFNGINLDQWNTLISTIIKSEGRELVKPNNSVIGLDFGTIFFDSYVILSYKVVFRVHCGYRLI